MNKIITHVGILDYTPRCQQSDDKPSPVDAELKKAESASQSAYAEAYRIIVEYLNQRDAQRGGIDSDLH